MAVSPLTDFLHAKAKSGHGDVDWVQRRVEWQKAIDGLFSRIVDYLSAAVQDGSVKVGYQPKLITEEFLGTYETHELVLQVGDESVVFSPKGRNIVGAMGRVDLRGEAGEATLVLIPDEDGR